MKLLSKVRVGPHALAHRVVHAPMTRLRAEQDDSPSEMMLEYYRQRASDGGLIIVESTHPSPESRGYLGAPGIYSDEHVEAWKPIVEAIHAKGGRVFLQLGHDGRQSHSDLSGGKPPIAPSVVPFETMAFTHNGWVPASMHRAVEKHELPALVESYRVSAERALQAGFDGIEMHNANGYLLDTFLQDGTNQRSDEYGGAIENRVRFPLQVLDALVSVWGAERVGVRVSPSGQWGSIADSNPQATFEYYVRRLNEYGLAYLHVIEPRIKGTDEIEPDQPPVAAAFLRPFFDGPIIAAGGFDRAGAEAILQSGAADLVAFGRHFSSNPDLPERLRHDLPLTPYVRDAFWGGTEQHYNDFPAYST
ncbi:alkene reductase [Pseudomonas sp. NPDC090202]|uniref:alkene reductase n=1 Tax=unclassified Pseudomonas TaxID=196821 RepID=UPI003823BFCE